MAARVGLTSSKFVRGTLFRTIFVGIRQLRLGIVDETDSWFRPSDLPSEDMKNKFARVVAARHNELLPETQEVFLKHCLHPSKADPRDHWTIYEFIDHLRQTHPLRTSHMVAEENKEEADKEG